MLGRVQGYTIKLQKITLEHIQIYVASCTSPDEKRTNYYCQWNYPTYHI